MSMPPALCYNRNSITTSEVHWGALETTLKSIIRGEMIMNIRQKAQIETMKKQGCTIRKISNELNVPVGTIKSYLSRRKSFRQCECCGKSLSITSAHIKRFCSDKCRMKWWRENKEVSLKMTKKVCPVCNQIFLSYPSKQQVYCSRQCSGKARWKNES